MVEGKLEGAVVESNDVATRKWKDCDRCRLTAHEGACQYCADTGSVPKSPPVAEPVIYYPPLDKFYADEIAKGNMKLEDVLLSPRALIVTDAVLTRRGGEARSYVEVAGWVLARSQRLRKPHKSEIEEKGRWVNGLGWVIPDRMPPPMTYVEGIKGPKDEPGHWNWRKEPE